MATADEILASVKARCHLVSTPQTLSDTDLLIFLNDELPGVLSLIKGAAEEHLVVTKDVSFDSGDTSVAIPSRALAGSLRTVDLLVDGKPQPLERVEPRDIPLYAGTAGNPTGYSLRGPKVVLLPTPTGSGTLRLSYIQRPGQVVLEDSAAQITAIDTGTGVLTFASLPSEWVSGDEFDFISQDTPNQCVAIDKTSTGLTSTTLTFATLPDDLVVSDWVALAGQSPFPSIPQELDTLLSQTILCRWLSAAGSNSVGNEFKTLGRMRGEATSLLTPRTLGSVRRVINYSGPGWRRWR